MCWFGMENHTQAERPEYSTGGRSATLAAYIASTLSIALYKCMTAIGKLRGRSTAVPALHGDACLGEELLKRMSMAQTYEHGPRPELGDFDQAPLQMVLSYSFGERGCEAVLGGNASHGGAGK
jgi:hypothetical protein